MTGSKRRIRSPRRRKKRSLRLAALGDLLRSTTGGSVTKSCERGVYFAFHYGEHLEGQSDSQQPHCRWVHRFWLYGRFFMGKGEETW